MANSLLTISQITKESVRVLENNLKFAEGVNKQYDDQFAVKGAKVGDTINVRKPARYKGRTGATMSVEDHTETSAPLTLDKQFGVDLEFTSKDLTLSLDEFSDRIIVPAMATVANEIDADGLALYKNIYNSVGTPGTVPTALKTYLEAGAKLNSEAAPRDGKRSMIIEEMAEVEIVDALKGLFHSGSEVSKQYKEGLMGKAAGFMWGMDQNVASHVIGAHGGTPLINGASQTGASLVTDGWTASAAILNEGDVFTIAGVYAVNPQTRKSTGQLRQFVVTGDVVADGSGNATIPVSPSIDATTAFQSVDAVPADNAAITVLGTAGATSRVNMAYHKDAFILGCADLQIPKGVDMAARVSDSQLGISARMVRAYDINSDKFPCRFDVLYGWLAVRPELACRVMG